MELKECTKCKILKPCSEYYMNSRNKKPRSACKTCCRLSYTPIVYISTHVTSLENEFWKPIKGYESLYQVSNLGRVKRLERVLIMNNGFSRKFKEMLISCTSVSSGYLGVGLVSKKSGNVTRNVHRLVAKTFIPNPENKPQVNHINGIKTDNRVENLEWCTRSENRLHAYKTGLQNSAKGQSHGRSTLLEKDVIAIREIHSKNNNIRKAELAKKFNTSSSNIYRIIKRELWSHI